MSDENTTPAAPAEPSSEPPGGSSVTDELAAIRKLVNALEGLDAAAQRRVLAWLVDRYQLEPKEHPTPA